MVEALGSLLLVLALFGLFLIFLYALFPSGTPLKELMEGSREPAGRGEKKAEATLSGLTHDVRLRRGNSIAWGGASEGMRLYSEDAVQTFDRSGARIAFDAADQLQVGSNSLVVVTRLVQDAESGPRSYRVQVDGELRGSLAGAGGLSVELATAGHRARLAPGAARFRVAPNGKHSSTLAVYQGEAQLSGEGGGIRVPAHYGVLLNEGVPVGRAVPLPAAPALGGEEALYPYRLLPPRVRFSWSGGAGDYHFQLSSEPRFASCLIDQRLGSPELVTGKLAKGRYYWRVSRLEQGVEGSFSRVGRCTLQQLLAPPGLKVNFPPESAAVGPFTISGESEPDLRVFVDGVEVVSASPGKFQQVVRLRPGVNLIRVEAIDPAGNASYASRIVYGRPSAPPAAPPPPPPSPPGGEGR